MGFCELKEVYTSICVYDSWNQKNLKVSPKLDVLAVGLSICVICGLASLVNIDRMMRSTENTMKNKKIYFYSQTYESCPEVSSWM